MGRPRKTTPTIDEHNGQVRARWTNDAGRQEIPLGPADRPEVWKAEHAKLLARLAVDPNAAARPSDAALLCDLCADYMASPDVPVTKRTQYKRVLSLLLELHAGTPLGEFDASHYEDWRDHLCRQRRQDGEPLYAVTTVRAYMGIIRRVWAWAVRRKRIPAESLVALDTVPGPRPEQARPAKDVEPANDDDVTATLPYLRSPPRAMVQLQRLTGARPSELFRLTPADVLREGRVRLPLVGEVDIADLKCWLIAPLKHKTARRGKGRWIPLGPQAREVIAPFLENRPPDVPCFSPREARAERNARSAERRLTPLWPSHEAARARKRKQNPKRPPGSQYTRQSYYEAVQRACRRAGVAPWSPYQLRHARLTEVEAAMGLDAAQHAGGQTNPNTTRRYARLSLATAARVAAEMG